MQSAKHPQSSINFDPSMTCWMLDHVISNQAPFMFREFISCLLHLILVLRPHSFIYSTINSARKKQLKRQLILVSVLSTKMETKFFISIIIICAALILISAQVEGGALRSGFGEPCDHNLKCNKSQWLSCQEGVCDCTKPDEMIFDIWKSKCVSKAGERCKFEEIGRAHV